MKEAKYPCIYRIIPSKDKPLTKKEIAILGKDEYGGCDAILLHSIIFGEDGSRSELIMSYDGVTGKELSDTEVFKCFVHLAHSLMESKTLGEGRRLLCEKVFFTVQQAILAARADEEKKNGGR